MFVVERPDRQYYYCDSCNERCQVQIRTRVSHIVLCYACARDMIASIARSLLRLEAEDRVARVAVGEAPLDSPL